jgi:hypothetical protein
LRFEEGIELKKIEARCFESGSIGYVCVPGSFEGLEAQSFGACQWLKSTVRVIRFEASWKGREFSEGCFENCHIESVCIPQSIEIFPRSCFACSPCWNQIILRSLNLNPGRN